MAKRNVQESIPIAVREAIRELGALVGAARRERRITQKELAQRVGVGRVTVHRMERGDPGIAIGWYLTASWILGLPVLTFADFAGARHDSAIGVFLDRLRERLPDRVRSSAEADDDGF